MVEQNSASAIARWSCGNCRATDHRRPGKDYHECLPVRYNKSRAGLPEEINMTKSLTIELSDELSEELHAEAVERGKPPEHIAAEHLEWAYNIRNPRSKRQTQLVAFISVGVVFAALCLLGAGFFAVTWIFRDLHGKFAEPSAGRAPKSSRTQPLTGTAPSMNERPTTEAEEEDRLLKLIDKVADNSRDSEEFGKMVLETEEQIAAYRIRDNPQMAERILRKCQAIREKKYPNDLAAFNSRSMLGEALLRQQKYAEAEPLLLGGLEGLRTKIDDVPLEKVCDALMRLITLYDAWDKPEELAKWKAKWQKALDALGSAEPEPAK